jgi:DNA-binding transcriptional regulator YiaG
MTGPMHQVRAAGEYLYGPLWQREMARALGVSDRAVRRWIAGDTNPPEDIGPRLRKLIDKRITQLRAARSALPK